jgi:hypothetical protein
MTQGASAMFDLELHLDDQPGALAAMGTALGAAGVSVEGGGVWTVGGRGIAHFLFRDGDFAKRKLELAGIEVVACRKVVRLRLKQDQPGQLGLLAGSMANAGINIEVLYSDHDNWLVLVPDNFELAARVAADW